MLSFSRSFLVLSLLLVLILSLGINAQHEDDVSGDGIFDDTLEKEFYDSEEFVGVEEMKKKKEENVLKNLNKQTDEVYEREDYYLIEIGYISFIVAYAINFWFGRKKNETIAKKWCSSAASLFAEQFSKLSGDSKHGVFKEDNSTFLLKASGRYNCVGMQVTLNLRKRYDLWNLLLEFFYPVKDTLTLEVIMNEDSMDNFVFCLLRKKDEKNYRKQNEDLIEFTSAAKQPEALPSSLCVLTEHEELISAFLQKEVISTLTNYEDLFVRMHFSDRAVLSPKHKKTLQFVFEIPTDTTKLVTLTKMCFFFIDLVAKTSLSKNAKSKATKQRNQIEEKKLKETLSERQEAMQQKKLEKQKQQKKEWQNLSPEEKAKREEKLKKREQKKKMPKMKMKIG